MDKHKLPIIELTQKEYLAIPFNIGKSFLQSAPFGFRFHTVPDADVIGEIVKGGDLFVEQWGAGLCVPEKGVNRYRTVIIEKV